MSTLGHIGISLGDAGVNPLAVRARLGRREWRPPVPFGDGWRYQAVDDTGIILVTAACFDELPGVPIVHASMSRHQPERVPDYADLCHLHAAVFPSGNAIQCFVPPSEHVNLRDCVLHLWGRADGLRLWPIDFGRYGTI